MLPYCRVCNSLSFSFFFFFFFFFFFCCCWLLYMIVLGTYDETINNNRLVFRSMIDDTRVCRERLVMYRPMGTIRFSLGCYCCCSCCLSMGTTSVQYVPKRIRIRHDNKQYISSSPSLCVPVLGDWVPVGGRHFVSFSLLLFIFVSLQFDSLFVFDSIHSSG